ncbi:MAG: DUF2313 domain-containing protein [Lachnospiraceae bacterium]|nr:DUF2313 domain-containing protein [Lachnospiraceae bacterium]
MQTLILNHYPPVINQIKEMQQIAKAEDIEFAKLNTSIKDVIKNMFVFTADEIGVQRFEKIFGISPKASQSLEDRKLSILFAMNKRKMSISELLELLINYADVKLVANINLGELLVEVGNNTTNIGIIRKILDDFMPLNVFIAFATEIDTMMGFCKTPKTLEMETTIYLCGNTSGAWFLDGSELLDGSRLLDAEIYEEVF